MSPRQARWLNKLLLSGGTLLGITVSLFLFCISQKAYVTASLGNAVNVVIFSLYATMLLMFFAVSVSNPGILEKQRFPASSYNHLTGTYRAVAPQKFLDIQINGQSIRTKYCVTCHMYRPPRTVHCSVCGGCVFRYDHHCPYVNNCVGGNNYRRFAGFVISCCVYFAVIVTVAIYRFVGFFPDLGGSFEKKPREAIGTVISIATSMLILWLIGGLCCFHVVIVSKGQSTYDRIKGNFIDFNPFYRGCLRNVYNAFCGSVRLIQFVNPWSSGYQLKTLYIPGAMFKSEEHRGEVPRHNSLLNVAKDIPISSLHDQNTIRYMQAFGRTDATLNPVVNVETTPRVHQ